jgi:hypothetical protein
VPLELPCPVPQLHELQVLHLASPHCSAHGGLQTVHVCRQRARGWPARCCWFYAQLLSDGYAIEVNLCSQMALSGSLG